MDKEDNSGWIILLWLNYRGHRLGWLFSIDEMKEKTAKMRAAGIQGRVVTWNPGASLSPRSPADGARPTRHGGEVSPLQPEGFGMIGNRPAPAEIEGSCQSVLDRAQEKGFDLTSWCKIGAPPSGETNGAISDSRDGARDPARADETFQRKASS